MCSKLLQPSFQSLYVCQNITHRATHLTCECPLWHSPEQVWRVGRCPGLSGSSCRTKHRIIIHLSQDSYQLLRVKVIFRCDDVDILGWPRTEYPQTYSSFSAPLNPTICYWRWYCLRQQTDISRIDFYGMEMDFIWNVHWFTKRGPCFYVTIFTLSLSLSLLMITNQFSECIGSLKGLRHFPILSLSQHYNTVLNIWKNIGYSQHGFGRKQKMPSDLQNYDFMLSLLCYTFTTYI